MSGSSRTTFTLSIKLNKSTCYVAWQKHYFNPWGLLLFDHAYVQEAVARGTFLLGTDISEALNPERAGNTVGATLQSLQTLGWCTCTPQTKGNILTVLSSILPSEAYFATVVWKPSSLIQGFIGRWCRVDLHTISRMNSSNHTWWIGW